ncbi:glycine cleavage system H protein [Rubidibacter lacunae KORDI 51-2]|uniref:Glycine cleavage system H protein n=1 Tax=Rubidibacter lacunae KORDI 51-2 TaxID=582515 RepID=U5DK65_9CHRO|nr:glycine cleavage system protein GcvH [Rubidibacter lacunae]ERN40075.1 glycine cleavage system H protein [Rubidibacter lacunae KORDI 51-2]
MALEYPESLKYADSHEYASIEGDVATVGLSAYAVDQLGDIVFVELPEPGDTFEAGEEVSSVESVKAVGTVYAPVSGEVVDVNEALVDTPELLNKEPYEGAWLIKIRMSNPSELDKLLPVDRYRPLVEGE